MTRYTDAVQFLVTVGYLALGVRIMVFGAFEPLTFLAIYVPLTTVFLVVKIVESSRE